MVYVFHSIENETVRIYAVATNQDEAVRISIDLYEMRIENFCTGMDENIINFIGEPGFQKQEYESGLRAITDE